MEKSYYLYLGSERVNLIYCGYVHFVSCAIFTLQLAKFISSHRKELFKQSPWPVNHSEHSNNGSPQFSPSSGPGLISLLLFGTMSNLMNPFTMPSSPPRASVSSFTINQSVNQSIDRSIN